MVSAYLFNFVKSLCHLNSSYAGESAVKCALARLVVCHCINIFYKCEHYHMVLCMATEEGKKVLQVIWYIKVFHSSFAFIKSIGRLIGLTRTHPKARAFIRNCVFCARHKSWNKHELCRFKQFYSVYLCFRNTWWLKYFITLYPMVTGPHHTPRSLFEFARISKCNRVLINSNAAFTISSAQLLSYRLPWLALLRRGADCSKTTLSIQ